MGIDILGKPTRLGVSSHAYLCSGARDRPPITGNVKRGSLPIAQLGPAPGEAALQTQTIELNPDASLEELIRIRSRLLADLQ